LEQSDYGFFMTAAIEPLEVINRIDAGAFLLDVRESDEWEMGHAPAAVWIPLGELASRVSEIPADSEILVICRSGGRSATAAEALIGSGLNAINCQGGMQAWAQADLPVITADGSAGQVA
jgi:rhodanese-related sulfurtransferase